MNSTHTRYTICLLGLAMLFCAGCKPRIASKPNAAEQEAMALVDSLRNPHELSRWIKSYERQGEKRAALIIRQMYGKSLRDASNFEGAIAQHDSCITVARELADTLQLIIALNHQGTNMRRMGDLQMATDLHFAALELSDEYSDQTSEIALKNHVRSLNGLGNVYMSLGNNEAAEDVFKQALEGEAQLNSATGQAINLANIGSIKAKAGEMDSARIYYTQSMEKNQEANNIVGISLCYHYLGELEDQLGNNEAAIENFRLSYDTGLPTGDVWHWLEACNALANTFLDTHQLDSAAKYIELSMNSAISINSNEHKAEAYSLRSRLEEERGQNAAALKDMHISLAYADSLESEKNAEHTHNQRVNYESKRRIREVQKAEIKAEDEKKSRLITIWSAGIILVLLGTMLTIQIRASRIRNKAAKTLQHANNQLLKASEERQQFYRNITHQLRTPLTVVIGMVNQLESHIAKDDTQGQEELAATQRQSRELLELVSRLIKASKEGSDTPLSDLTITNSPIKSPVIANTTQPTPTHSQTQNEDKKNKRISVPTPASKEGASVLIAEDNDDVATLIQNIFRNNGYVTRHARDGQEALEMLTTDELPDLIISDIAMPRMDGLELIRNIRNDDTMNHLPIIVVSARVEDSERLEGLDAGAEVYLAKPFIVDELLLRAHKLLQQRDILRRKFRSQEESEAIVENMQSEEKTFFQLLNAAIDDNISEPTLTSSVLADKLCMSRSQLNRRVKNLTGDDTSHYIRNRRMMLACHLLATTSQPIGHIETQCGFDTPGYFSRTFRSLYNMTPSDYRKQHIK